MSRTGIRVVAAAILLSAPLLSLAQGLQAVALPKPRTEGGKPLLQVLKERRSTREFSAERLSPQLLSDLLWAAWGVNRADGRRTAPSAMNRQELDVYIMTQDGAWRYDAKANRLEPVAAGDHRAAAGTQPYVATAALNLVYAADTSKTGSGAEFDVFMGADAGFVAQNVYLFCASEGLVTVVRGSIDKAALAKLLHLRETQRILLSQSVGYPKKR